MAKRPVKQKQQEDIDVSDLMTQADAAKARGVSRAAITDLVKRGRLRTVELFGKKLVYRSEIESFEPENRANGQTYNGIHPTANQHVSHR